jgi:hypothetical protein
VEIKLSTIYTFALNAGKWSAIIWKAERQRSLLGPRRRRKDNIKMNIKEIELGGMDLVNLAQNSERALVSSVINFRVPWNVVKYLSSWVTGGSEEGQLCSLADFATKNFPLAHTVKTELAPYRAGYEKSHTFHSESRLYHC